MLGFDEKFNSRLRVLNNPPPGIQQEKRKIQQYLDINLTVKLKNSTVYPANSTVDYEYSTVPPSNSPVTIFEPGNSQFFCDKTSYRKLYFSQTRKKHQTIDKIAGLVVKLFTITESYISN